MKRIVKWIFLGPAKDYLETGRGLQIVTVNMVAMLGTFYTVVFFTQLLLAVEIPLYQAVLAYFATFIFATSFIASHTEKGIERFYILKTIVSLTLILLYGMVYAVVPHGDKWAFLIPPMCIFMMELKWGVILSAIYFAFMVIAEILFDLRSVEMFARYAAIYWAQVALIIAYEILRNYYTKRLQNDKAAIEFLSVTDYLTKLYNRRYFSASIEKEYARAIRQKETLSFLMIDVDYFKKYNDAHGHLKGDEVLISVANILMHIATRSSDLAFRMGGEEFGMLLPDTDAKGASLIAERIRVEVGEMEFVTVSVGYASVLPHVGGNPEDLFKAADDNLYKAKAHGRNKVVG